MIFCQQLPEITSGTFLQFQDNILVEHLLTDSRKVSFPSSSVFFAITGDHHDGHDFIKEAYDKGIRVFIVEKNVDFSDLPKANVLLVEKSIPALQKIAIYHRNQFDIPVIGIIGSNGKTIVKEWIDSLLHRFYNIVKSPKSFNSQIGVPLSVWQMNATHTLGVLEAGVSKVGEMEKLAAIIQPTIGLFTNIGTAHDEGFKNRKQKIQEKLKLFKNCPVIIYCLDQLPVHTEINNMFFQAKSQDDSNEPKIDQPKTFFTWSRRNLLADVHFFTLKRKKHKHITILGISDRVRNKIYQLEVPFIDKSSLENLMHCLTLAIYLGIDLNELQSRLRLLKNPSMRLELKQGINGCYLIDDAYNNDIAGLSIALDFLSLQQQRERKTVILSDVLQSGMKEEVLYQTIAELLENHHIDKLIGIGEEISRNKQFFPKTDEFYQTTEDFLAEKSYYFSDELILVKGARKFQFEKIVARLEQKTHGTVLEINLDAIYHNLRHYRSLLKPETKIMAMVKAFAYGSGSTEIASLLQFHRVDYLSVAYADEGVDLRKNGIDLPIMVLNPSPENFDQLLQFNLEPNVYSREMMDVLLYFLKINKKKLRVHLAFDTGMHRLGFGEEDLDFLIEKIRHNKDLLEIAGLYTHLAAADEPENHYDFTLSQLNNFKSWSDKILSKIHQKVKPLRHALNTPGIVNFTDYQMDMVRLGIGLYGVGVTEKEKQLLKPVGTLKTTISQIKHIKAGESVGYGRWGKTESDIVIATIAIGYADGYSRNLGKGVGKVLINNELCPVIGNICMDMTMVNITGVDTSVGSEVIVFGENPTIYDLSEWRNTIPYEVLTSIGERVKRVFYTE